MSETDRSQHRGAMFFSKKLLGLNDDCVIGGCREKELSTGWLLYNRETECWMIGFRCPVHGSGGTWRPEWKNLIDEVIADALRGGVDVAKAVGQPPAATPTVVTDVRHFAKIVAATLRVSNDPGHGGSFDTYSVKSNGSEFEIRHSTIGGFPAFGSLDVDSAFSSKSLERKDTDVKNFLGELSEIHRVFELSDLPSPSAMLHPTSFSFEFQDAAGREHSFVYTIEAGSHHNERYRRLVQVFDAFFAETPK